MKQKIKQWLGVLLSISLMLGLMPGMSLTAYAYDENPYASLVNQTTDVTFDGKTWYIIKDNSTAVDAGTVTLLAEKCVCSSQYNSGGSFVEYSNNPTVKTVVDNWYDNNITADAKTAVSGGGMFLLTKDQAIAITNADVRKCTDAHNGGWWLCSQGSSDDSVAVVLGGSGEVNDNVIVGSRLGVRPALELNLSSVIFSSGSKEFSLKPAGSSVTLSGGANATLDGATSRTGLTGAMTTVTYTANTGYYFEEFADISSNGITARRTSSTVVTVSGTPTADATIMVPDAVEKTAATVTKAPTARTLTYNSSTQELVTAGEATGGTMYYAVTTENTAPTDDNLYTTSIPTKTDAGTYYVWYKAVGDENHSDSDPKAVTVMIGEAAGSETGNTESQPGAPTISGSNMAEVVKSVVEAIQNGTLTNPPENIEEIKAALAQPGAEVTLTLVSTPLADNETPAQDKNALDRVMQTSGYDGYAAFDLSLLLTVKVPGSDEPVTATIHNSDKEVTFTLNVPDNLKKVGRTFFLLHTANGITNVVGSAQNPGPLSGSSTDFSTYAIAYKDAVAAERFTFKKVWMGDREDEINFKV